jgi:hypothetical protein
MRITDEGGDNPDAFRGGPKSSIMDSIKAKATVSQGGEKPEGGTHVWDKPMAQLDEDVPKITADVQSAKLKQLLGKIKSS